VTAEATRASGLERLERFSASAGGRYAESRNFDFGPDRRANVSMLSPYLRHRLVLEQEVLETVLSRHSYDDANKFIQEVFWRAYFKGWLEQRRGVWEDYRDSVSQLLRSFDTEPALLQRYETAVEGRTGIECFDAWVTELVSSGYLHNHARMWFASIWVYTLGLPWQLGADFFYRHLVDGDPASNTLSWRWVCGLHTKGKTYLARASNIARFTDNRFDPAGQLAGSAPPLTDTREYPIQPLPEADTLERGEHFGLLITEEDGYPESLIADEAPGAVLGAVATRLRSPLPIGDAARRFAAEAMDDAVARTTQRYAIEGEWSDADDWGALLIEWARRQQIPTIVTAYVPAGPVRDLLDGVETTLARDGVRLLQLRRDYDTAAWAHARQGYFKMKEKIPTILEGIGMVAERLSPHSRSVRRSRDH
jgi:deoxyribodipyrimidine photo-lyase